MLTWKPDEGRYTCGQRAFSGRVSVGVVWYDATQPKGDPLKYSAKLLFSSAIRRYKTEAEAVGYIEASFKTWIEAAALVPSPKVSEVE